jgi:hypothetical protein
MNPSFSTALRSIRRIALAGVVAQAALLGAWYATADESPTVVVNARAACSCAAPPTELASVAPATPI